MKVRFQETAPGVVLTLLMAMIADLASTIHPSFDLLVISLIFGMLVSNIVGSREMFEKGIKASVAVFLPVGIALYGLELHVGAMDGRIWAATGGMFVLLFCSAYFISKGFGLGKRLSYLLAAGMSVCGATAIAVVAPLLESETEETSISLISVLTVGLTGMLLFYFLHDLMDLSVYKYSFLSGTTLPMLGQVKVAAGSYGLRSLELAVNYKLFRIAMLLFVAAGAVVLKSREKRRLHVPWFMVVFFALAIGVNASEQLALYAPYVKPVSSFVLCAALTAIGLSIDLDAIVERGPMPLFAVAVSWVITVLILYLLMHLVNV